ncbi:G-protein coupled receptor GRL101-like protein [Trichoplax sp. H2]|nr:G-protein coupled receptor GRL101-like protein [Trichoplax sp. H2]|eukprot:RDD42416.1 G-protein coupled receptor GRL101-like protein [Trichoplax sp. H2]
MSSILFDNYLIIIILWVAGIAGIVGNSYVLYSVFSFRKIGNTVNTKLSIRRPQGRALNRARGRTFVILIFNLAIGDLLGSGHLIIVAISDIRYRFVKITLSNISNPLTVLVYSRWLDDPACYLARFLHITSITISICLMGLIAIDRFFRIVFPFSTTLRITSKYAIISVLISWLASMVLAILGDYFAYLYRTFGLNIIQLYQIRNLCTIDIAFNNSEKVYLSTMIMTGSIIYIMAICMYGMIAVKIRRISAATDINKVTLTDHKMEKRVFTTAIVIAITNFITWFPAFITGLISVFNYTNIFGKSQFIIISAIFNVILQANCSINPIIFVMSTRKKQISILNVRSSVR